MKKKDNLLFLLQRILIGTKEENLIRLDEMVVNEDGGEEARHELIGNSNEANFTRLKSLVLSLAKEKCCKGGIPEKNVIELLIEGYTEQEIARRYKSDRRRINNILVRFRQRLKKQKITQYLVSGKYRV